MNKQGKGIVTWMGSFGLVIFFILLLLGFVVNFISETTPDSQILNDTYGLKSSITSFNNSLSSLSSTTDQMREDLEGSNPTALTYLYLIFQGAFYIPFYALSFATSGMATLTIFLFNSLGGTGLGYILSLGIGLMSAILTMSIIFYIIKAIRTGISD